MFRKVGRLSIEPHTIFKVPEFQQENYTENFIQSTLDAGLGDRKRGATLVVGGDGRYLCPETVNVIIQMSAANGVCIFFPCKIRLMFKKIRAGPFSQNGFLTVVMEKCLGSDGLVRNRPLKFHYF